MLPAEKIADNFLGIAMLAIDLIVHPLHLRI
jgi:hypothetical protein